jgi:hypothetical protein
MRLPSFQLESDMETAMRKLKQATQRERARRKLKEGKAQGEAAHHHEPPPKSMSAGTRNGHSPPTHAMSTADRRGQKATLH